MERMRMSLGTQCDRMVRVICLLGLLAGLTACSTGRTSRSQGLGAEVITVVEQAPGVVEYTWEEPMVDVVEVPPGLDPEGHYYRPSHKQLREIRQGRWQRYSPD